MSILYPDIALGESPFVRDDLIAVRFYNYQYFFRTKHTRQMQGKNNIYLVLVNVDTQC